MRVIVTGQSGINKGGFLGAAKEFCDDKAELSDIFPVDDNVAIDKDVLKNARINHVFDLEHEVCKKYEYLAPNYLDKRAADLLDKKNIVLDEIIKKSQGADNVILAMHLNYLKKRSLCQIQDWEKLREFEPDIIVVLIDDIYSIKRRIDARDDADDYVRGISLKDIAWWREAEIAASQNLAMNLQRDNIPIYIIAVSHGPQILYQLMFESKHAKPSKIKKMVYASYPITAAKEDESLQKEVDKFIKDLKSRFIVFDPSTIKEKKLQDKFVENFRRSSPIGIIKIGSDKYQVNDVAHVIIDINGQIITRDERLIEQSDAIFAYRPEKSSGAVHEIKHAKESGHVHVFVFSPTPDSPFSAGSETSISPEEFQDTIKKYAQEPI